MPYKFFLYSNNIIFKCNCFYEEFSKKKNYKHIYTVYYVVRNKKHLLTIYMRQPSFFIFFSFGPAKFLHHCPQLKSLYERCTNLM